MASIYLVKALYNKPSAPAAPTTQSMTEVKQEPIASDDQSAAAAEEPTATTVATDSAAAAAAEAGERAIEVNQIEVKHEQQEQQKGSGDAMHPARQLMVEFLGPLDEQPEPVPYKVTGANMAPLGHTPSGQTPSGQTPSPGPKKRYNGAMNKQKLVAPEPPAWSNTQAARERSFKAVAASATAAARLGQQLQGIGGNQINAGRDPRRRAQAGSHEAPSSPAPASVTFVGRAPAKQDEVAWDASVQPRATSFAFAAATVPSSTQRAGSAPYHPMVSRDQLYRSASTVDALPNTLVGRPKQLDSDPASDSEARIRELEDENLGLRQAGFRKDRTIRKLKADILESGIRTSGTNAAAFGGSIKRPRCDEDVGGPVMEP